MKKLYIVANWKSNKTTKEAQAWMVQFLQQASTVNSTDKTAVICPPAVLLSNLTFFLQTTKMPFPLHLGSQDIGMAASGAYTGEEPSALLKEYVDYTIIGHSERRQHFAESDALIAEKIAVAKDAGITPILCVQGKETPIPEGVTIVAYEPVSAIGTGNPDTPENADSVAQSIKEHHDVAVLYGGSVKSENVHSFTQMEHIDGVLVGGASLDPVQFSQIINNA